MPGSPTKLGPFDKGLHNGSGTGEYIDDAELFDLVNLEVDIDGSLANRPAISTQMAVPTMTGRQKVLGAFIPDTAPNKYLVVSTNNGAGVSLVDTGSQSVIATQAMTPGACAQYGNRIYVCADPSGTAGTGGYFNSAGVWTTVAAMPQGQSAAIYNDRLFIAAGVGTTNNASRLFNSAAGDPTVWSGVGTGAGFNDINPGDGQKLAAVLVLNQDIMCFKEHSTYRAGYSSDVTKIEIIKINSNIGAPSSFCVVSYNNNNIYVIHDNAVYELYNYSYNRISAALNMDQSADATLLAGESVALTLFRNRLFVRYYSHFYVYTLLTGRWCKWVTNKKFSRLVVIPNPAGDIAYAHPSTTQPSGTFYTIVDDRVVGIVSQESFNCFIITKTYDFELPFAYKVMFWWGMTIASSGAVTANVKIPNYGIDPSWNVWKQYQWQDLAISGAHASTWSNATTIAYPTVVQPDNNIFVRKFLKFNRKVRYRQAYFTVSTPVAPNTVADAVVRIYDMTVFVNKKEIVTYQTT